MRSGNALWWIGALDIGVYLYYYPFARWQGLALGIFLVAFATWRLWRNAPKP